MDCVDGHNRDSDDYLGSLEVNNMGGKDHMMAFASRLLTKTEHKYAQLDHQGSIISCVGINMEALCSMHQRSKPVKENLTKFLIGKRNTPQSTPWKTVMHPPRFGETQLEL